MVKDRTKATKYIGNVNHCHDHNDVNHDIFYKRNYSRRAKAGRIGIECQNYESHGQWQMRVEAFTLKAQPLDYFFHAHKLQSNIGHSGQYACDSNGQFKPFITETTQHKIACCYVAMLRTYIPKARQENEAEWINQYRIRNRKEAISAKRVNQSWHGNYSISGIEITTD